MMIQVDEDIYMNMQVKINDLIRENNILKNRLNSNFIPSVTVSISKCIKPKELYGTTKPKYKISEKNIDVLEYIYNYINENGYAPSNREIGKALGIKSTSTVQSHIDRLLYFGCLTRSSEKKSRTLRINEQKYEEVMSKI